MDGSGEKSEYEVLPYSVDSETGEEVQSRMTEALTEIAVKYMGKRVIVVSHGGAIREFINHVRQNSKNTFPEYKGIRTAVNCFRYCEDGSWSCILINDDSHIESQDGSNIKADAG